MSSDDDRGDYLGQGAGGRARAEELTREIADIFKRITPPGVSFLFMFADHGTADGWMTYAASVARGDAVAMLRELAFKLEAGTVQ